ncbi:hypothetical protein [Jiangella asiatica]|uniref:Integrase SAM-like N-terminal domain-containing protein n=1 Tax=Jiangella asiatica TaxID=2530372 RepID=A0A4V2Z473_9ACTN|nr:hypothetical protein [Jiangella asiatica]TDE14928.1 hypothetical protein E1269_02050 [Jiangella asiatica]
MTSRSAPIWQRAPGTSTPARKSLILPHLEILRLREVTVGRIEQLIKRQATVSYAHAKHSRRMVSMMFNFALRHDAVHMNPVAGAARLSAPKSQPKA